MAAIWISRTFYIGLWQNNIWMFLFYTTGSKAKYNFDDSDSDAMEVVPGIAASAEEEDEGPPPANDDPVLSDGSDFDFAPTKTTTAARK